MRRSLACGASLVIVLGAGWSCSPFAADDGTTPSPEASTSDASADAPALDAPPPDAGGGVEGGLGDAGPSRGPKCAGAASFCAPTERCCFQFGGAADTCQKPTDICARATGSTSVALLTCTDRASCPAASPVCCVTFNGSNTVTGSTCQANACAAVQLCAVQDECAVGTSCTGVGGTYGLDPFHTFCQ